MNNVFKFKYFYFICIFFAAANINNTFAEEYDKNNKQIDDPVQFLHSIIEQVLTNLKKNHSNRKDINRIVDNLIMPKVNFEEMCQWITGKSIWAKSTDKEKSEFIKELKILLIKTYSSTLKNYTEEKIEFQHYTGNLNNKRIQIKSTIIRVGKESISVDYRLIATSEGSWQVYDLIIEGVSILQGFRAQFGDDVKMHGINFVINKIKEHNLNNNSIE